MRVSMCYSDTVALDPAIGAAANYVFSCNGMYDPDITGTGNQPRGFDQLMAMYDHYIVKSGRIKVDFHPNGSPMQVGIILRDSTSVDVTRGPSEEARFSVHKPLGTSVPVTVTQEFNISDWYPYGIPLTDLKGHASSGGNPAEQIYYHVRTYCVNGAADPNPVYGRVLIEYDAELVEPTLPSQS